MESDSENPIAKEVMKKSENSLNNIPDVAVIIVNWNGRNLLGECLSSLSKLSYPKEKILTVVVDNGSDDGSVDWVVNHYPDVLTFPQKINLGFAKANNIGITEALKNSEIKYIVTLNNDTEITSDWLKILVDFMEKDEAVGVAVGKILQLPDKNKVDSTGDFFHKGNFRVYNRGRGEVNSPTSLTPEETLSCCAAASIFRRKTLEELKIGHEYFDENFISYLEDVDLCVRARLKGWSCFYVPKAVVYHWGSMTSKKLSTEYKDLLSKRNRILFAWKNFPFSRSIWLTFHYILPSREGLEDIATKNKIFSDDKIRNALQLSFVHLKSIVSAFKLFPVIYKKRLIIRSMQSVPDSEINRWFKELVIS
jgi:GT2 family glycosyltransferase